MRMNWEPTKKYSKEKKQGHLSLINFQCKSWPVWMNNYCPKLINSQKNKPINSMISMISGWITQKVMKSSISQIQITTKNFKNLKKIKVLNKPINFSFIYHLFYHLLLVSVSEQNLQESYPIIIPGDKNGQMNSIFVLNQIINWSLFLISSRVRLGVSFCMLWPMYWIITFATAANFCNVTFSPYLAFNNLQAWVFFWIFNFFCC